MQDLAITIIQSTLHWENSSQNLDLFAEKISSISKKTDLLILPEMFSTGFTMNATACAEEMEGRTVKWLRLKAKEKNCVITGSIIIREKDSSSEKPVFYNRLIWMKPDGTSAYYDKRHLFRLANEEQTYTPGDKKIIPEINGWKILPLICYDLRFPVWSRRTKQDDYDLLIYVANWPERRLHAWRQLLIARAIENQSYVAGVNRVGEDGNKIYHSGYSTILDFKGEPLTPSIAHEPCVQTISLNKQTLSDFRSQYAFGDDADAFHITK